MGTFKNIVSNCSYMKRAGLLISDMIHMERIKSDTVRNQSREKYDDRILYRNHLCGMRGDHFIL